MDSKILRMEIKRVLPDYKDGYDHYSIVWKKFNSIPSHGKAPESLIVRELRRMRHYPSFGVVVSGAFCPSGRGTRLNYFAKSGGEAD